MDSEFEKYLKEMISFFEDDGGASNGEDMVFIDEVNTLTDYQIECINAFNQGREYPLQLVVNTGKSNLKDHA